IPLHFRGGKTRVVAPQSRLRQPTRRGSVGAATPVPEDLASLRREFGRAAERLSDLYDRRYSRLSHARGMVIGSGLPEKKHELPAGLPHCSQIVEMSLGLDDGISIVETMRLRPRVPIWREMKSLPSADRSTMLAAIDAEMKSGAAISLITN